MAGWLGWQTASQLEAHTCGRASSQAPQLISQTRPAPHTCQLSSSVHSSTSRHHPHHKQQPLSLDLAQHTARGIAAHASSAAEAVVDAEPADLKRRRKLPAMPFVKIVGQEEMKLALLLNVVDPRIGGVLIMGDRGTGKSVAVRSLAELLPNLDVVADDPFNSSPTDASLMGQDVLARGRAGEELPVVQAPTPLVELPLGATEDRICGTIDIERALQEGIKAFEPGLLARCNRGILYVDEVNLLDDGIVDLILDSAAGGVNTVEREGISVVHPAKFIMIGSGNPSEGELRPQLLDRFGLSVQVFTLPDIKQRVTLVLDRLLFEQDPDGFVADSEAEQEALRARLRKAQQALPSIQVDREVRLRISEACSLLDVDGIRGDIVTNRAAAALAAYEGRDEVTLEDVSRIIGLCLGHRLRKDPLDPIDGGAKVKLAWQRVTNPKAAEAAAEKRKQAEAEEKKAKEAKAKSQQKSGSWGGLPGKR